VLLTKLIEASYTILENQEAVQYTGNSWYRQDISLTCTAHGVDTYLLKKAKTSYILERREYKSSSCKAKCRPKHDTALGNLPN
jgi:hypothetical protein